jgi:hypothetical protein
MFRESQVYMSERFWKESFFIPMVEIKREKDDDDG